MQLELWAEPSSVGPERTPVEKIMLMLYTENTLHEADFSPCCLLLSVSSWEDGPLKASSLSRFSDAALEACLFFCLREPEYTEHMPAVLMAAASESDNNMALSVALQNTAMLRQGVARFMNYWTWGRGWECLGLL